MKTLSLVYSYYNNPNMFQRHLDEWATYPEKVKNNISIIVTDDCSDPSISIPVLPKNIDLHIFRIQKKVSWNWIACRNIGVKESDAEWILVTDMDHLMSTESINKLMRCIENTDSRYVYLFQRVYACTGFPIGSHTNTYLMTREMYWKIGGYNERLSGLYHGTTGEFQKRIFKSSRGLKTLNIPLTLFCDHDISDANTSNIPRGKPEDNIILNKALKQKIKTLSFAYSRIL